ncbi:hypothetical protein PybrP1_012828 [[Pythium] brassicae (nom. inval.)]|nr:hypothetical protein PybrP1_012828 [[Pythium] brassicae (nom. inval.)]
MTQGPTGTEKVVLSTATGAFFGAAVGSVESVWSIPKLGDQLPKFATQMKHLGVRSLVFASAGAIYSTGEFAAASIRQKDDQWNAAVGGLLVGAVPAILKKNARIGAATSVAAAITMSAATYWAKTQDTPLEKYAAGRVIDRPGV